MAAAHGVAGGGARATLTSFAKCTILAERLITKGLLFRPVNRFGKVLDSRLTAQSVALIIDWNL